jgi:hypothetical protein
MKYFEKAGVSNKNWNLTVPRAKLTIPKIIFQAANPSFQYLIERTQALMQEYCKSQYDHHAAVRREVRKGVGNSEIFVSMRGIKSENIFENLQ